MFNSIEPSKLNSIYHVNYLILTDDSSAHLNSSQVQLWLNCAHFSSNCLMIALTVMRQHFIYLVHIFCSMYQFLSTLCCHRTSVIGREEGHVTRAGGQWAGQASYWKRKKRSLWRFRMTHDTWNDFKCVSSVCKESYKS